MSAQSPPLVQAVEDLGPQHQALKDALTERLAAACGKETPDGVVNEADQALDPGARAPSDAVAQAASRKARDLYLEQHLECVPLAEFARSGRRLRIRSRLLDGETVLLAADNAALPNDNDLVVYRAFEMVSLLSQPELLRKLHLTKKMLDAVPVHPDHDIRRGGGEFACADNEIGSQPRTESPSPKTDIHAGTSATALTKEQK